MKSQQREEAPLVILAICLITNLEMYRRAACSIQQVGLNVRLLPWDACDVFLAVVAVGSNNRIRETGAWDCAAVGAESERITRKKRQAGLGVV